MISREEYLKRVKESPRYQRTLNKLERKKILADANKKYDRRIARIQREAEFEKELEKMNEAFMEGYLDGLSKSQELDEDLLASIGRRYGKAGAVADKAVDSVKSKLPKIKKLEILKQRQKKKPKIIDRVVDKAAKPLTNYHTKKAVNSYTKRHGHAPDDKVVERFKKGQVAPATRAGLKGFAKVDAAASLIPGPTSALGHAPIIGLGVADEIKKNRQMKKARQNLKK
jgi:hypothetical protein